ncbi:MAG: tRNA A-37 threonylcarbamoyl transferase component Bud32 [Planctomycetota bacterium]|jgi:tRNA A-37 threonylcarbamoyl transferase component Bud32
MASLSILEGLPNGYFIDESPRGILALSVTIARTAHEAGFGPDQDGPLEQSDLSGRRPLFQMELNGECFVVRRYNRGGLFRWFFPRTSLDPSRPFRELILADSLARSGIQTPDVVGARAVRWGSAGSIGAFSPGWRLELVSRRISGAIDYGEVLEAMREGRVDPSARMRLMRAAGAIVRSMHSVGFLHADLTPRNLLVRRESLEKAAPEPWVLDLDGSVFVENLTDADRRKNLRRLLRSAIRREKRGVPFLSRADFAHFLRGYDPEARTWKQDWKVIQARHKRGTALHLAGWALEGLFGSGAEKRDGGAVVR